MAFWTDKNVAPIQSRDFSVTISDHSSGLTMIDSHNVKSVTMPSLDVSEGTYRLGNHVYKYPGQQTWQDVTITLVETDLVIQGLVELLREQGYDWSGSGAATKQTLDIIIKQHQYQTATIPYVDDGTKPEPGTIGAGLDAVGNAITGFLGNLGFKPPPKSPTPMVQSGKFVEGRNQFHLKGAWIKTINFGQHDYSNDELITMEMTVAYDHCEFDFLNGVRHPFKPEKTIQ